MKILSTKVALIALAIPCIFLLLYAGSLVRAAHTDLRDVTKLRFSNTQQWAQEYLDDMKAPSIFTKEQIASITLPPPPVNDSAQTKEELLELHAKVLLRTPEKMQEINDENTSAQLSRYGTTSLQTFVNPSIRPNTSHLIDYVYEKTGAVILLEKQKYDRVRASYLDPTLVTALPVPSHASYPSGHSTQAHMVAGILGRLDPKHANMYFDSAERIGIDREIAGLHYPSDTEAGRLLAAQLIDLLFQDPTFVDLYNKSKAEW